MIARKTIFLQPSFVSVSHIFCLLKNMKCILMRLTCANWPNSNRFNIILIFHSLLCHIKCCCYVIKFKVHITMSLIIGDHIVYYAHNCRTSQSTTYFLKKLKVNSHNRLIKIPKLTLDTLQFRYNKIFHISDNWEKRLSQRLRNYLFD